MMWVVFAAGVLALVGYRVVRRTVRRLLAYLPPYHTPESVAREIVEGLENGTVVLSDGCACGDELKAGESSCVTCRWAREGAG